MSDVENYLTIAEGDSLTIASGDHISVGGGASVSGTIDGDGTLGLNWTGFTSEETQENISAQIVEENIPSLVIQEEVSSRTLIVSVEDIGAESYTISLDDETPVDVPLDTLEVKFNGLEPSSVHSVRLTATNSRGESITDTWSITMDVAFTVYDVDQSYYAQPNKTYRQNAVFMARLINKENNSVLTEPEVESITLRVWKYKKNIFGDGLKAVHGHIETPIPTDAVLMELEQSPLWTVDNGGINFLHVPNQTEQPIFPEPGSYLVEYEIRLKKGNPINLHYDVYVY